MDTQKRMAGDYEIIHAMQIGDQEIVVGENQANTDGQKYMCAFCQKNDFFVRYDEVLASNDYICMHLLADDFIRMQLFSSTHRLLWYSSHT